MRRALSRLRARPHPCCSRPARLRSKQQLLLRRRLPRPWTPRRWPLFNRRRRQQEARHSSLMCRRLYRAWAHQLKPRLIKTISFPSRLEPRWRLFRFSPERRVSKQRRCQRRCRCRCQERSHLSNPELPRQTHPKPRATRLPLRSWCWRAHLWPMRAPASARRDLRRAQAHSSKPPLVRQQEARPPATDTTPLERCPA